MDGWLVGWCWLDLRTCMGWTSIANWAAKTLRQSHWSRFGRSAVAHRCTLGTGWRLPCQVIRNALEPVHICVYKYIYIYILKPPAWAPITISPVVRGQLLCVAGTPICSGERKGSPYVGHWVVQRFGISYQLTLVAEPPKRGSAGQAIRGFFERHGRCKQWFCGWKHENVFWWERRRKRISKMEDMGYQQTPNPGWESVCEGTRCLCVYAPTGQGVGMCWASGSLRVSCLRWRNKASETFRWPVSSEGDAGWDVWSFNWSV